MALSKKRFNNIDELKSHVLTHAPTFYYSSRTSTVIPYDKIEKFIGSDNNLIMGDLSGMPAKMELLPNGNLVVTGAVSWKDARIYLKSKSRNIMTAPTEELALVTAGAATSCTGERSFSFGNLRSQIVRIKYIDFNANEIELRCENSFSNFDFLDAYQKDFKKYENFKNAPYPRFEKETDLLIGTEGQLGVITELELKTVANESVNHLFMLVPKWEEDYTAHLEIIEKIQSWRDDVILCELIDSNAFSYLPEDERPNQGVDAIFFEIKTSAFDNFYENFLATLENIDENNIFELSENKFHHIRASIPRHVFEVNSKMGVVKMGTDVQVNTKDFSKLLDIYRGFSKIKDVRYNLFGHFGDAHLHFNFMPLPEQVSICQQEFESMYKEVVNLKGSPFAEHGIGLIKQKFIKQFWNQNQLNLFKELKEKHDPYNQFFPQGFMSIKSLN